MKVALNKMLGCLGIYTAMILAPAMASANSMDIWQFRDIVYKGAINKQAVECNTSAGKFSITMSGDKYLFLSSTSKMLSLCDEPMDEVLCNFDQSFIALDLKKAEFKQGEGFEFPGVLVTPGFFSTEKEEITCSLSVK
jgi:hypothetical protein